MSHSEAVTLAIAVQTLLEMVNLGLIGDEFGHRHARKLSTDLIKLSHWLPKITIEIDPRGDPGDKD